MRRHDSSAGSAANPIDGRYADAAMSLSDRTPPRAACTLAWAAFKQSTDSRPVSIARIVQRRAAIQNACRCPVEQNR